MAQFSEKLEGLAGQEDISSDMPPPIKLHVVQNKLTKNADIHCLMFIFEIQEIQELSVTYIENKGKSKDSNSAEIKLRNASSGHHERYYPLHDSHIIKLLTFSTFAYSINGFINQTCNVS